MILADENIQGQGRDLLKEINTEFLIGMKLTGDQGQGHEINIDPEDQGQNPQLEEIGQGQIQEKEAVNDQGHIQETEEAIGQDLEKDTEGDQGPDQVIEVD